MTDIIIWIALPGFLALSAIIGAMLFIYSMINCIRIILKYPIDRKFIIKFWWFYFCSICEKWVLPLLLPRNLRYPMLMQNLLDLWKTIKGDGRDK